MATTARFIVFTALGLVLAFACSPEIGPPIDGEEDAGNPLGSESCDDLGLEDYDGDTISDEMEGNGDSDGDGLANARDDDSDGDGHLDVDEAVRRDCGDPPYDSDDDGIPDYLDLDSDDNRIPDADENDNDIDGDGIPNWRDRDDDGDRINDDIELGPDALDPADTDVDGISDYHDDDSDGDGILDITEGSEDIDLDGLANFRDLDSDGDGLDDEAEGTGDCDGDGLGNWIDTDSNGDGIPDWAGEVEHEGACPPCAPECIATGEIVPSADDDDATGLVPNPDGPGVIIGSDSLDAGFAWIANTNDPWPSAAGTIGTVTKLDLETGEEVARYVVGFPGQNNSPSRTAVDGIGDAYVACRAFGGRGAVSKIAANLEDCIDRNRNGRIETSNDSTPLPHGEDECVMWTVQVGGSNSVPRALVIDLGGLDPTVGYPWVGLHSERRMVRLDPIDGAVLDTVVVGVQPYGAALDSLGSIWISSFAGSTNGNIQRLDSVTLDVDPMVRLEAGCAGPYGIATDIDDRVWVGAYGNHACRYDPMDGSWFKVDMPIGGITSRGIAVDPYNVVWVAAHGAGIDAGYFVGFDAEDGAGIRAVPTGGSTPVGIAVDSMGYVWAVNQGTSNASRLDPFSDEVDLFPVGTGPYTYSDFTGFQRARVWTQGSWSGVFERCADQPEATRAWWRNLVWAADVPSSTSIEIHGQTADTEEELADAESITLAELPGSDHPLDIEEAFERAGITTGRFLLITVILRSGGGSATPVFENLEVSWECDEGPVG